MGAEKVRIHWRSSWHDVSQLTIAKDGTDESMSVDLSPQEMLELATSILCVLGTMHDEDNFKFAPTARSVATK